MDDDSDRDADGDANVQAHEDAVDNIEYEAETDQHPEDPKVPSGSIHFLVSSKHMILASPVFKAMPGGYFKEGLLLRASGKLKLPLPDDDPIAFEILLNIIHGHHREVPRYVSLWLLTRLAILVDKYQMLERLKVFSDMWINELQFRGFTPEYFTPDTLSLSWLSISWVFRKTKIFRKVTRILEMDGGE